MKHRNNMFSIFLPPVNFLGFTIFFKQDATYTGYYDTDPDSAVSAF